MTNKPSVIFVSAPWHTGDCWHKVASALEDRHHRCSPVTLPTTQSTSISVNFSHDVKSVRDAILVETTQGLDVVVAVHNYGGLVGASAIKGLTRKNSYHSSTADAKAGHVIGLFMIATSFLTAGISFMEAIGGKPLPWWAADYENNRAYMVVDPMELFYHDLPEEEAKHWTAKQTKMALTAATDGYEATYEGWREVPVWFVMTLKDRAMPIQAQRMLSKRAKKEGADLTVCEIDSGHFAMLSKPDQLVDFFLQAFKAFAE